MRVVRMRTTSFLICTLRCKLFAIKLWYSSSIMRSVRQCNARSVTVVTSILMHIERRKNKFKVDLVSFFISMLELKLELKLEVGLKVGLKVGFSSGPDSNKRRRTVRVVGYNSHSQ